MKLGKSAVVFSLLALFSCGNKHTAGNTIYTSFYTIYDFTKKIVGDKYQVENLTPYGQEPHDYEPTAKQIAERKDSPLLLLNGLGLDKWSDSLPKEYKSKAHLVTEGIETRNVNNTLDPHVWLSVKNAKKERKNILDLVCERDKENADYFKKNYDTAIAKFDKLDQDYQEKTAKLNNKYIVVSHAAFGYLCHDYGMTQIYVSGLEPDATPTAKDREKIIDAVNTYHITTIFYEDAVGPDIADAIKKETGVKTETLNPLEGLSKEEENTEDYISVREDNLNKIVAADTEKKENQ